MRPKRGDGAVGEVGGELAQHAVGLGALSDDGQAQLVRPGLVDIADVQDFQLVSGTPKNGTWHATFVVPGGTPDGTYFIQVALQDSAHFESWVSSDSGWTSDSDVLTPDLAPSGVHFVVANS